MQLNTKCIPIWKPITNIIIGFLFNVCFIIVIYCIAHLIKSHRWRHFKLTLIVCINKKKLTFASTFKNIYKLRSLNVSARLSDLTATESRPLSLSVLRIKSIFLWLASGWQRYESNKFRCENHNFAKTNILSHSRSHTHTHTNSASTKTHLSCVNYLFKRILSLCGWFFRKNQSCCINLAFNTIIWQNKRLNLHMLVLKC